MFTWLSNKTRRVIDVSERCQSGKAVYSMGRCGSTALEGMLSAYHVHCLYSDQIFNPNSSRLLRPRPSKQLFRAYQRSCIRKNVRDIYIPLRDPKDRILSIFFQMLPIHMQYFFNSESDELFRFSGLDWDNLDRSLDINIFHDDRYNLRYLVFRIEDLAKLTNKYPDFFPSLDNTEASDSNSSKEKWYYPVYKTFKESKFANEVSSRATECEVWKRFYQV